MLVLMTQANVCDAAHTGPPLPQDKLIMSVNWNGVSFFETKDNIFLELPYAEMIDVVVR